MSDLRETASIQLNVPKELTYIGPGIAYLFRLICQSTLRPGEHVAICEPTPDWVKRCILAVGAAYVDIGRDWRMNPLAGAMERLLEDGDIRMVFSESVCSTTGAMGIDPRDIEGVLWVQDHTYNPSPAIAENGLHLLDFSLREGVLGLPICIATGLPHSIESLWRLDPNPPMSQQAVAMAEYSLTNQELFEKRCNQWAEWREALKAEIATFHGLELRGQYGPASMLRHVDMTSTELQGALEAQGITVEAKESHTYHDHVIIRVPEPAELQSLQGALEAICP